MKRITQTARPDAIAKLEHLDFSFHQDYWREDARYEFTAGEIDQIESVTNELHQLCLEAIGKMLADGSVAIYGFPDPLLTAIRQSWEQQDFSLYGRFDLLYDHQGVLKLLEYNADTPTALYESSVVQWYWLQDVAKDADQLNSLHEQLIARWGTLTHREIWFTCLRDHAEDHLTTRYLMDVCAQAGHRGSFIAIDEIGWDGSRFVADQLEPIEHAFKLYPWEWALNEPFGPHVTDTAAQWIEPAWKMLLSSKVLLPLLHKYYPDHPNILPAYFEPTRLNGTYARKSIYGREGLDITLVKQSDILEQNPGNGTSPVIYQALVEPTSFDGQYPVLGSWIVGNTACGMGIREDTKRITGNTSRFVPHLFRHEGA